MARSVGPDPERRARLLTLKLAALVRDHTGTDPGGEPRPFAPGAAIVDGARAWMLVDEAPAASLGRALAWATNAGITHVDLLAEQGTGALARQAASFTMSVDVWHVAGRMLLPAVAEPLPAPVRVRPEHERFREMITDAGADPIEEHGVLGGEVLGLEVCRVVTDSLTGEHRLEVGVGAHDREAFLMMHGGRPSVESLAEIVRLVTTHRRPGAEPHPLNRLAPERLLRWHAIDAPPLVGASVLAPAPPPTPRGSLRDIVPCVATGIGAEGSTLTAVFSAGIDLTAVPFAVDARSATCTERTLLIVPERDRSPVTQRLASMTAVSIEVVGLPDLG